MKTKIVIENLKCQGCVNTITKSISAMEGVTDVTISLETSEVTIMYSDDIDRTEEFVHKLKMIGYPRAGENSAGQVVKSYVSCAIGRMVSKENNFKKEDK
jgi:copper chaperone